MNRLLLAALLLSSTSIVACASETEDGSGGRFDDDIEAPTRSDDVVATKDGDEQQPAAPAADAPSTPAPGEEEKPATTPPQTNTCSTARDLGSIAGDADGSNVTAQGTCSEWLKIKVNETSSGALARAMKLTATLVSPANADFDLRVYVNKESDITECTTVTAKSELPASRSDVVKVEWGEGWTVNFGDDSRTVSIEVRAKDPSSCGKGNWALVLEGNE